MFSIFLYFLSLCCSHCVHPFISQIWWASFAHDVELFRNTFLSLHLAWLSVFYTNEANQHLSQAWRSLEYEMIHGTQKHHLPWHLSQVLRGCSGGRCDHLPVTVRLQPLQREQGLVHLLAQPSWGTAAVAQAGGTWDTCPSRQSCVTVFTEFCTLTQPSANIAAAQGMCWSMPVGTNRL